MKFQVDHLNGLLEKQLNALVKFADVSILHTVVIETDNEYVATLIETLVNGSKASPATPFIDPEPEPAKATEDIHQVAKLKTTMRHCLNCGDVFEAWRKDQLYCKREECQRTKAKNAKNARLAKEAGKNGNSSEIQAEEAIAATSAPLAPAQ